MSEGAKFDWEVCWERVLCSKEFLIGTTLSDKGWEIKSLESN